MGYICILLFLVAFCVGDFVPPTVTVNLDVSPEERWTEICAGNKKLAADIFEHSLQKIAPVKAIFGMLKNGYKTTKFAQPKFVEK